VSPISLMCHIILNIFVVLTRGTMIHFSMCIELFKPKDLLLIVALTSRQNFMSILVSLLDLLTSHFYSTT
jgi:hypothetical protein